MEVLFSADLNNGGALNVVLENSITAERWRFLINNIISLIVLSLHFLIA